LGDEPGGALGVFVGIRHERLTLVAAQADSLCPWREHGYDSVSAGVIDERRALGPARASAVRHRITAFEVKYLPQGPQQGVRRASGLQPASFHNLTVTAAGGRSIGFAWATSRTAAGYRSSMTEGVRGECLGGYDIRLATTENGQLTHVDRATEGGEYLRRYWHPIALAEELSDLPVPLRVLGEDLVLFRDGSGRIGLLHRRCSHRGTSLEYGCIEEHGIRCCYHGWLYDVDGTILETPAEPETSGLRTSFMHGAYPTREYAGLVFAYLGPPRACPPFPVYDTWLHPAQNELVPFKLRYPCNWVQLHENTADPIHISFLHGRVNGVQFSPGFNELPSLTFADSPLGLVVASTRFAGGRVWVRTADVMLPNIAQYPPAFETGETERLALGAWATRWIVPIDNTNSWVIGYRHFNESVDPNGQGRRDAVGIETIDFAGQTAASEHDRQRNPGDYEAMVGQGPIAIHANEHLTASDRGVVRTRRLLREEIARVRSGGSPQLPRVDAAEEIATYTAEVAVPWSASASNDDLALVGERVVRELLEGAHEPHESRIARLRACITDVRCQ
jgi:nitrite reductase/ring-hydroxylating ferredoxin subunit